MSAVTQMSPPLVLVTGGAGFLGAHLCRALHAKGFRVRVVDNFATSRKDTLREISRGPNGVDVREADVRNLTALRNHMAGVDWVVHLAGLPSVPGSVQDPGLAHAVNLEGTVNVLMAAKAAKVKRVVYGSTGAIYGDRPEPVMHEALRPRPRSPLAAQALAAEHYMRLFAELYGIGTVCLRYFNLYGPGQDGRGEQAAVIPRFVSRLLRGEDVIIYGTGQQARDFVHVSTAVEATLSALQSEAALGRVFNVGSGQATTINDLFSLLVELCAPGGAEPRPRYAPARPGDVRQGRAALSRTRALLGVGPGPSLRDGLSQLVEAMRRYRGAPAGSRTGRTSSQTSPLPSRTGSHATPLPSRTGSHASPLPLASRGSAASRATGQTPLLGPTTTPFRPRASGVVPTLPAAGEGVDGALRERPEPPGDGRAGESADDRADERAEPRDGTAAGSLRG